MTADSHNDARPEAVSLHEPPRKSGSIVLVLLVMRSLLRRAVVMHVELDEVI